MKEFNLSDKIEFVDDYSTKLKYGMLEMENVKEFIRLLKYELKDWGTIEKALEGKSIFMIIDKLAGKDLK